MSRHPVSADILTEFSRQGGRAMTRLTGADRDAAREEAAARYTDGQTVRQIAHETGQSEGSVYHLLHEAGVELRPRGADADADADREAARTEAAELYQRHRSIRVVAGLLGASYGYSRRLLIEAGITLQKRGWPAATNHGKATR